MSGAPDPCPVCGKPCEVTFAPFCSRRCAQIDLGRWLRGSYVIPGAEPDKGTHAEPDDEENPED
ncbi:MAG TPA: DNA gyrase inhibitor YacG [Rhizomicrobium sp.]|jgi:uncharacterized protein|nr:DNA gyrase inhibitor YacG [Rhizomicrobium sp.]